MKLKSGLWPSGHYFHRVTVEYGDVKVVAIVYHQMVQVLLQKETLSHLFQVAAAIKFMRFPLYCSGYFGLFTTSTYNILYLLITGFK